jgi:outer membrane protein assembly factor BamD (BamD/ComL family)
VFPEVVSDYRLRRVVGATVKAIAHYDNRYGDKPGVPYALWMKKFEEYLKPLTVEDALKTLREHFAKKQEDAELKNIEEVLKERLGKTGAKEEK